MRAGAIFALWHGTHNIELQANDPLLFITTLCTRHSACNLSWARSRSVQYSIMGRSKLETKEHCTVCEVTVSSLHSNKSTQIQLTISLHGQLHPRQISELIPPIAFTLAIPSPHKLSSFFSLPKHPKINQRTSYDVRRKGITLDIKPVAPTRGQTKVNCKENRKPTIHPSLLLTAVGSTPRGM